MAPRPSLRRGCSNYPIHQSCTAPAIDAITQGPKAETGARTWLNPCMALSGRTVKLGRAPHPSARPSTASLPTRAEPFTVSGYNHARGPEWNSAMYVFANEGPLIQVRDRLLRGSDGPHGKCAGASEHGVSRHEGRSSFNWRKQPRSGAAVMSRRTREHDLF